MSETYGTFVGRTYTRTSAAPIEVLGVKFFGYRAGPNSVRIMWISEDGKIKIAPWLESGGHLKFEASVLGHGLIETPRGRVMRFNLQEDAMREALKVLRGE